MQFSKIAVVLFASAAIAAPTKLQARDELECAAGDMACTGLVTRDELECAAGDMACTGVSDRNFLFERDANE
jgi:uncharacterized membrane protein